MLRLHPGVRPDETAQRGLLETFCTLSLATVMKLNSATLISGHVPDHGLLELLVEVGALGVVELRRGLGLISSSTAGLA